MLERGDALNLLEIALRHSTADQTEVALLYGEHGLTRLANSRVHQNVVTTDTTARVRAVIGKRVGVAVSNRVGGDGLRALVDRAIAMARVSGPNPEFTSLPAADTYAPTPFPSAPQDAFNEDGRSAAAATLVNTAMGNGVTAAGHAATTLAALAVGNSLGVRAYHAWAESTLMAIMTRNGASGYAQWSGTLLPEAPVGEVAAYASGKCLVDSEPITLEPGRYTVILEPPAAAELLIHLAFIGLGATAYQEGRSFMSGKLGEQLVGTNINLRDDAYHVGMIRQPFDFEGVPKRVVRFFHKGVASGVVYDSYTANKAQRESTGHALPAPNPYGPLPWHLVLEPAAGAMTREHLLRGVTRGILITRFHYVNVVHPKETSLTGMTRDGTFLIENGVATRPVKNLRFTQSVLEALSRVSGMEQQATLVSQEGMYCLVPTLRIEEFQFTSGTG